MDDTGTVRWIGNGPPPDDFTVQFTDFTLTVEKPTMIVCHSGWTCPKCGSVYAPFVQECSRCNKVEIT